MCIIQWFLVNSQICATITIGNVKYFHHLRKRNLHPAAIIPLSSHPYNPQP